MKRDSGSPWSHDVRDEKEGRKKRSPSKEEMRKRIEHVKNGAKKEMGGI